MDIIKVVCGIIYKDRKILLCRRAAEKNLAGYWEFPGGKTEEDENEIMALKRELAEELGMLVEVKNHYKNVFHDYQNIKIQLIGYICDFKKATFQMSDHDKYKWVEPSELLSYKLAPADIPIATQLSDQKDLP